jgi:hypothetical protein
MRDGRPFGPLEFTCWFIRAARKRLASPPARPRTGFARPPVAVSPRQGCADSMITAVSGHRDPREVARYRRAAEQRDMARKAMGAVTAAFSGEQNTTETFFGNGIGNPSGKWSQKP